MTTTDSITAERAAKLAGEALGLPDPERRAAVWFGLLAALVEREIERRRPTA